MKGRLQGFFEGLNISANDPTFGGYIFPTEKPFEVKQALVRPKLNNGQEWNHPDKPLPAFKTVYPHDSFKNGVPIPHHSDMLMELRGQDAIGFNLQPAALPFYPEDARVKALAEGNQEKENAMREMHHPPKAKEPLGFVEEASKNLQLRSKYSPETFDRLIALGFSEEDIAKAVQDEVQKDIRAVLDNPSAYTREIDTAAALESMYERWAGKRAERETGTDGAIFGNSVQNPNTFRAAGTARENLFQAEFVPLPVKTGAQRAMKAMREGDSFMKDTREMFPKGAKVSLKVKEPVSLLAASLLGGSNAAGGGGGGGRDVVYTSEEAREIARKMTRQYKQSEEGRISKQKGAELSRAMRAGESIADQLAAEEAGFSSVKEMKKALTKKK